MSDQKSAIGQENPRTELQPDQIKGPTACGNTTITVGDAEYTFDLATAESEMVISLFLTESRSEERRAVLDALSKNGLKIKGSDVNSGFFGLTTKQSEFDPAAIEEVLNAAINEDLLPDRYQIVCAESDWGAHVSFVTVW